MGKQLELLTEIEAILRKGHGYWYKFASDYQSRYAFTSDYSKSDKMSYYRRGDSCRRGADRMVELLKLNDFPENLVDQVKGIVASSDVSIIDRREIEGLIEQLGN